MRVTNEMYPRGSVIVPRFPKDSERAFLHGRPLIVVSTINMFNSLVCVECTSRDRPGIEVSIFNHYTGKYLSDTEASIACPYVIHDIPVKCIMDYLGVITPITMQAITDAMAWHLGISSTPPKYMEQILAESYNPVYNMGTTINTSLNIARGVCSSIETHRQFSAVPYIENKGVPYKLAHAAESSSEEQSSDPGSKTHTPMYVKVYEWVKVSIVPNADSSLAVDDVLSAYNESHSNDLPLSKIGLGRYLSKILNSLGIQHTKGQVSHNSTRSLMIKGIAFASPPNQDTNNAIIDSASKIAQRLEIFNTLSTADRTNFLLRRVQVGSKYENMSLDTDDINWLIRRILDSLGFCNPTFTTDLAKGIESQGYHWNFIDTDKVVALMLYGDWDQIKPSAFAKLEPRFRYLVQSQHLDFSDLRKWPKIMNGKELKSFMRNGGGANRTHLCIPNRHIVGL